MASLRLEKFQSRGLDPGDLGIAAGECVTLAGPSGSGKTLLLRAIADLDPHRGEAWVDGQACSETPPPEWRRRVALLPAESHWWGDRVGEHLPAVDRDLLSALGFTPECLEWEVSRLSSGERQRLALARMLSLEPEVLLLDEPTANLDQGNGQRVETLIGRYREQQGAAVLWVSHDPDQRCRVARRGFLIEGHRLVEETWS
ncbi:MAG TPA: ABC transporter ATP-binding protein [Sedimenticola sp.]|nr:ABC transporter ATP-binding protein [Sedimenticola sp.]